MNDNPWTSDFHPVTYEQALILGGRVSDPRTGSLSIGWPTISRAIGYRTVLEHYVTPPGRQGIRINEAELRRLQDLHVTADQRGLRVGSLNLEVPTKFGSLDDIARALITLAETEGA